MQRHWQESAASALRVFVLATAAASGARPLQPAQLDRSDCAKHSEFLSQAEQRAEFVHHYAIAEREQRSVRAQVRSVSVGFRPLEPALHVQRRPDDESVVDLRGERAGLSGGVRRSGTKLRGTRDACVLAGAGERAALLVPAEQIPLW